MLSSSAGLILLPSLTAKVRMHGKKIEGEQLEKEFVQPPDSARPYAYWMWMNGNITKEGITLLRKVLLFFDIG